MSNMYTRAGDKGKTTFLGGGVVSKSDLRVASYGTIDELNACVGLIKASKLPDKSLYSILDSLQATLLTIGALLANPEHKTGGREITFDATVETDKLEKVIDTYVEKLPPLTSFILPGGTLAAAHCHLARTVARRAERLLVALNERDGIDEGLIAYLNRLSSAFFVFARVCNRAAGREESRW